MGLQFGSAHISVDGQYLTVRLPAPGPVCPGQQRQRFEPTVLESSTAVSVGIRSQPDGIEPGAPLANCAVDAMIHLADYPIRLAAPLGARVLLSSLGAGTTAVLAVEPA